MIAQARPRYVQTLPRRGYRFVAAVERQHRVVTTSHRKMQAVLPFGNLTGDPKQEYFADGMTEELIAQLGRMNPRALGVIAFHVGDAVQEKPAKAFTKSGKHFEWISFSKAL